MTKSTLERLATVEEQTKSIKATVDKLDAKFDSLIEKLDNRYPTRREFKAVNVTFGIIVTIVTVVLAILAYR